ncbi:MULTISPECIES: NlpC/P60 family protein [Prauserella salsuginis group]|uniref:Cell wall-associated NlpC family hydrolase n=2 Tax=Prauserella salsuginis group TaxID=2893672 RepID=A0A839XU30_9PSEU|nr:MULTISPECIES: NlpC/P60 family protein [Prauserella salsuginis group]MBB3666231.1 cell wall-associated NlpC family hydrolase [Prauserella sediminis]MCR3718248.1 Cell wall-associated hydrolase, NlpC family [Prauserella flava]MCR3732818.1 Cell wall-associated hydrolase, NlpC family [Prauserella salsuginis]
MRTSVGRTVQSSASQSTARPGGKRSRRGLAAGAFALAVLVGAPGTAIAVPPPPPNPSDAELESGRAEASEKAGEVGRLTSRLADADAKLTTLRNRVERKLEEANKARVDLQRARAAADTAESRAESARTEVRTASGAIRNARQVLDRFVAASHRQGTTIGSLSAYLGADSPKDLLAREQLLGAVGDSELDALGSMKRAQVRKSNKEAAARQALEKAREKRAEAAQAKTAAQQAQQAAVAARSRQASRAEELRTEKNTVEQQLREARAHVGGLEGQREQYREWLAEKEAEEEAQAQQAAAAASGGGGSAPAPPAQQAPSSAPAGASVEAAVQRAMSQLGVQYAWGGGNAHGPTYGIRDGGVADAHGDYAKIGFDCSGLMIYAFAGVQALPHYSGYQYDAGRKVPLSQMRRGDMLFWGNGGIHHVAMYLGNGQMIEAPYSGGHVRVVPVRYGDILPYATRLIG